jgi:hypothetical protein
LLGFFDFLYLLQTNRGLHLHAASLSVRMML